MDKTKVRIDLTEAWRALDRLEAALDQGDQRAAGNALYNIRQRVSYLCRDLDVTLFCTCAEFIPSAFGNTCAQCGRPPRE